MLVKLPDPVPFVVLLWLVVGSAAVFQHTPRAVTAPPPSALMVPPVVAPDSVMALTLVLVSTGIVTTLSFLQP